MKAILQNGVFHPTEPIPADWREGCEFEIALPAPTDTASNLDRWYAELEAGCARMSIEDDQVLQHAINEIRAQEKELARQQAALQP